MDQFRKQTQYGLAALFDGWSWCIGSPENAEDIVLEAVRTDNGREILG